MLNIPDADGADDAVAQELSKKVRILCWIMTAPQYLQAKARHVRATWGRRCNVLLVSESSPKLVVGRPTSMIDDQHRQLCSATAQFDPPFSQCRLCFNNNNKIFKLMFYNI